jgi:phage gp29-like protein
LHALKSNGTGWKASGCQDLTHRPQSWFQLHRGYRQELRLRTNTADADGIQGEALTPFGWITHIHKAKSGYLERTALFRQLVWTYLFKNYSVGDLAEFLEIYGIPVRLGKYPPNASEREKATLLRALVGIGHNAAGIIPEGMLIDFKDAATGDPKAFELMISWCERNQSKVILGGTLTSGADGAASTNALGNVHNEVRKDLRDGDIRQLNATITRDLVYAIAAMNGLAPDGIKRCPRFG